MVEPFAVALSVLLALQTLPDTAPARPGGELDVSACVGKAHTVDGELRLRRPLGWR